MKIYKFKDTVDGRFAFIAANSEHQAKKALGDLTSIACYLVEVKTPDELNRPIVLLNQILPF